MNRRPIKTANKRPLLCATAFSLVTTSLVTNAGCDQQNIEPAVLEEANPTVDLLSTGANPERLYGGMVPGVWMEPDPQNSGHFFVWSADEGPRIRRFRTADNSQTVEPLQVYADKPAGILHDVHVTDDFDYGFAVGAYGQAFWATNIQNGAAWSPVLPALPVNGEHLWEAHIDPETDQIWVAGNGGTFLTAPNPLASPSQWQPVSIHDSAGSDTVDFLALGFADIVGPAGERPAIAAGRGIVNANGTDVDAIFWTENGDDWYPSNIEIIPSLLTSDRYNGEIWIFDVAFVPGSTKVAFAGGGLSTGNGPGYLWKTIDGGKTWQATYSQCDRDGPNAHHDCPAPELVQRPDGACSPGDVLVGLSAGKFKQKKPPTIYGLTALSDGTAIAASYAAGMWQYDGLQWVDRSDSATLGTGPLWGAHSTFDISGTVEAIAISGEFSDIRISLDRGITYTNLDGGIGRLWRLSDVSFADKNTGWVVGQSFRIAKTSDGGKNWNQQLNFNGENLGPSLYVVEAFNKDVVVALGDPKKGDVHQSIYFTRNGGSSCGFVKVPETRLPVEVTSATPPSARPWLGSLAVRPAAQNPVRPLYVIGGNHAFLMQSTDGGSSWRKIIHAGLPPSLGIAGITFGPNDSLVIVGNLAGVGKAYFANNVNAPTVQFSDISTDVPTDGFTVPALNAVAAFGTSLSNVRVYAVGDMGTVVSLDRSAGEAHLGFTPSMYTNLGQRTPVYFRSVQIVSDQTTVQTIIGGELGEVYVDNNFANNFDQISSGTTNRIKGLSFLAPDYGYMTGGSHNVFSTILGTPAEWGDSAVMAYR